MQAKARERADGISKRESEEFRSEERTEVREVQGVENGHHRLGLVDEERGLVDTAVPLLVRLADLENVAEAGERVPDDLVAGPGEAVAQDRSTALREAVAVLARLQVRPPMSSFEMAQQASFLVLTAGALGDTDEGPDNVGVEDGLDAGA